MSRAPQWNQGHPEEELSALLDEELTARETEVVRAHLSTCPTCSAELDRLREARRVVRSMRPLVAPGDIEARIRRRLARLVRRGAAAAILGGLAAAAILLVAHPVRPVMPPTVLGQPAPPRLPVGVALPAQKIPPGYLAPGRVSGLPLVSVYRTGSWVETVYRAGSRQLTALEEKGSLDARLAGGERGVIDGHAGVLRRWSGTEAFTGQFSDLVVTVVADPDDVVAAARQFDRSAPSVLSMSRVRSLCRELVEDLTGSG